jgi:dipeptidyl aminopeptidase/acylaminoacyl peptidase
VDGYSWSPDSHRLVFVDEVSRQSSTILSIAIDGIEGAKVLVTGIYMPSFPEWSPNGTRILYISLAGESSSSDIFDNLWIMNADGTGQTQITRDLYVYSPPHWSPDGQWIVFAGPLFYEEVNTNYDLWIVDSKGKSIKRLTIGKANESMPNWSPDGAQIYFTRDNNDVWILSLATGQQTRLPLTAVDFITLPLITTVTSSSGFGETPPDWLLPGIEQALEIGDLSFFDRMTPEQVYYGLQGSEYFGSFSRSQFLAEVEARIGNRPMCTTYSYNIGEASVVWIFTTNWNPPWDFGGKAYSENLVFLFSDEGDKEKGLFLYGIAVNPTPDLFYGHGDYPCP